MQKIFTSPHRANYRFASRHQPDTATAPAVAIWQKLAEKRDNSSPDDEKLLKYKGKTCDAEMPQDFEHEMATHGAVDD